MITNNKCEECGGFYEFSPNEQLVKCVNCGKTKKIDDKNEIKLHEMSENLVIQNNDNIKHLKCENCGAEIVCGKYDIVHKCSYCGNSLVVGKDASFIQPDAIIPMAFNKEQAKEHFKTGIKKSHFVPNKIKKQIPDAQIVPTYISSFLFDAKVVVNYSGVLEYSYTETDKDGRSRTCYSTKRVSGTVNSSYANFVIECSPNLTQYDIKKLSPYHFNGLKVFSNEYLFGAIAEYNDKALNTAEREFNNAVDNNINNLILRKHNCDRVVSLSKDVNFLNKKYKYCLLPTYIINYNYKNKHYKSILNGQTGNLAGEVPRSPVKITFFVLFWILFVLAIVLAVVFL